MVPNLAAWAAACFVLVVLVVVARWGVRLGGNLRSEPTIGEASEDDLPAEPPLISVIIPAKDEEAYVEGAVRSVLQSTYPRLEVVVVNDRSRDGTAAVLAALEQEDSRITVITLTELPEGWTGKTHALFQGSLASRGEFLVFMDADTVLSRNALVKAAVFVRTNNVEMLSLVPEFATRGFSENVVHPHLILALCSIYPLQDVNDAKKDVGIASGAFIMIHRDVYASVGTWKRVKCEITEDLALGRAVKASGHRLLLARGGDLVRTRKFENLSELAGFWTRTLYGGLQKNIVKTIHVIMNYVLLIVLSACLIVTVALTLTGRGNFPVHLTLAISSVAMIGVMFAYGAFTRRESGSWVYGITAPIGIVLSAWIAFKALIVLLTGRGIHWRGSLYR